MLKMSSALLLVLLSLFAVMDCFPTTKGFSDTSIPIIRRSLSPRKNNNHTPYRHSVNINTRSSLRFSTTTENVEILVTTPSDDESTSLSMERKNDDEWHWIEDSEIKNLRINYRNDDHDENEEEDVLCIWY